jgi:hypothetical protein
MKYVVTLVWLAVVGWLILSFCSCSLDIRADGSKSFAIDGEMAAKAILIFAEK